MAPQEPDGRTPWLRSLVRSRYARYSLTALILLVIGTLFVQREVLSDDEATDFGLLERHDVAIGERAPDFVLERLDGGVVRLSDYRGSTVVLNFWASWCPPCRAEMPDLEAVHQQRADRGDLVVLAVDKLNEDSRGAVSAFVDEFELSFPVAFDASNEVFDHYRIFGLPATYFIDAEGVVRARNFGPVFGELLPQGIAAADAGAGGDG
jgi:peroxiredoxin